ncbi:hypothetical protein F511_30895 [Dorcoceras hygrometricum]|uniref:Uncharacterized protein n=1 Tax=Dorcoceras hygrometricum TaxID=472368 RepID=A0A2Z7B943_9LAMI|nr:hypothetical protein F511_30895 [Dorcoceras hygrometricum]
MSYVSPSSFFRNVLLEDESPSLAPALQLVQLVLAHPLLYLRLCATSDTTLSQQLINILFVLQLVFLHLNATAAGSVAPADPSSRTSEPTCIFSHETSYSLRNGPTSTTHKTLFDDLSCFSTKFLRLGLRNRV